MTVYKCYMKLLKRNMGLVLMYLAIFFSVTIFIQLSLEKNPAENYATSSMSIAVCNRDSSPLSEGLIQYLQNIHQVSVIPDDLSVMQEKLFYRDVEYIVQIPEDFYESCIVNGNPLSVTSVPGSYTSFYVDHQINSYLNSVRTYMAAGFTLQEASEASQITEKTSFQLLEDASSNSETPSFVYYFRYLPYLFLGSLCYSMGYILMAFRKDDIQKRMAASAVSRQRQNLEGFLAMCTIGSILLAVALIGAVVLYKEEFLSSSGILYYSLNTVLMLCISLCISYLSGLFVKDTNMVNGISKIISLGMCFLCGVFVPMDVMNKNVLTVSQFLPVYWFEKVNDTLAGYHILPAETLSTIWKYMGIEALYVVALLAVIFAISRYQKQG